MSHSSDFEGNETYRAAAELVKFVYELEDRFPQDELTLLFQRLRAAAIDVGARIAEGIGRDGVDDHGALSESTMSEARAALNGLRHYVLTSQQRFFLDEQQVSAFDDLYLRVRCGVAGPGEA